jgi:hypothetical protein
MRAAEAANSVEATKTGTAKRCPANQPTSPRITAIAPMASICIAGAPMWPRRGESGGGPGFRGEQVDRLGDSGAET